MYVNTNQVASLVRSRSDAQAVIAELLTRFSSEAAFSRVQLDARDAKQSTEETLNRTASNLLTSFVTRKPGGFVEV